MSDLAKEAFRRFEKVVRDPAILGDLPVVELSDGELAYLLALPCGCDPVDPEPVAA